MKEFKYSHFRYDGHYRATIAFKDIGDDLVAYGVAVASDDETSASREEGRRRATARCKQATSPAGVGWNDYNGPLYNFNNSNENDFLYQLKNITAFGKLGIMKALTFKDCIIGLRESGY